jgi:hypothetical protein
MGDLHVTTSSPVGDDTTIQDGASPSALAHADAAVTVMSDLHVTAFVDLSALA